MGVFCREVPDTDADFQWYEFVVRDGYAAIRLADLAGNLDVLAETEDCPSRQLGSDDRARGHLRATRPDGVRRPRPHASTATVVLEADRRRSTRQRGGGPPGVRRRARVSPPDGLLIEWHAFEVDPAEA